MGLGFRAGGLLRAPECKASYLHTLKRHYSPPIIRPGPTLQRTVNLRVCLEVHGT